MSWTTPAIGARGLIEADWRHLKSFSLGEVTRACQGGQWEKIDAGSLLTLDRFAGYVTRTGRLVEAVEFMPRKILSGPFAGEPTATWNTPATAAHDGKSWHYKGRAFDVMFPRNRLATAWLTAMRFPEWGGIGVYPFWRPDPGLHLDTRPVGLQEQGVGFRVLWYVTEAGTYQYLNDEADILAFLGALERAA